MTSPEALPGLGAAEQRPEDSGREAQDESGRQILSPLEKPPADRQHEELDEHHRRQRRSSPPGKAAGEHAQHGGQPEAEAGTEPRRTFHR